MEKTVTTTVPNELWVNDFSANKTQSFTYNGPDKVWLHVQAPDYLITRYLDTDPSDTENYIEVDMQTASSDKLLAATLVVMSSKEHTYTYTPETNHNGSIYQKINNPRLSDYFMVKYNTVNQNFQLFPIVKDTEYPLKKLAQQRKDYILKYKNLFDFDTEIDQKIEQYISSIDAYLLSIEHAYPWKYIEFNQAEIPKIPVSLIQLFNTLPADTIGS